jgi:hypothetical protein
VRYIIEQVWKFAFAVQNSIEVMLARAVEVELPLPGSSDPVAWHAESLCWHAFVVDVDFGHNVSVSFMHGIDRRDVQVVHGLTYAGGARYKSEFAAVSIDEFLRLLPVGQAKAPSVPTTRKRKTDAIITELPWVEKLIKGRPAMIVSKEDGSDNESSDDDIGIDPDMEASVLADNWDELADMRQQWENDPLLRSDDFKLKVLGGPWTLAAHGVISDALSGITIGEHAIDWCRVRALNLSFRCEIALYAIENCAVLVRTWCIKMQYYYNLSLTRPDGVGFTDADRAGFVYPPEFELMAATTFVGHARGQRRVQQIRNLFG